MLEDQSLENNLLRWRRHIHQHPELSFNESETASYIETELRKLGVENVFSPTPTSRVADIQGLKQGPGQNAVVAIRADIDALPVEEASGLPFCSVNSGVSHACGHDSHAAMLLGTASLLLAKRKEFAGTVRLIFQHAEEKEPGGAAELVRAGVMKNVGAVIGLHVMNRPTGEIAVCTDQAASTACDSVWINIKGCGTHASMPQSGVDPVLVGSEVVTALHTIVSRSIPPGTFAVISPTVFQAGTVVNVIPDSAKIGVNIRTKGRAVSDLVKKRITEVAESVCSAYGASCSFDWKPGCPAVIQDERMIRRALKVAHAMLPPDRVATHHGMPASEDFSHLSDEAPGVYVLLGYGTEAEGYPYQNHHPAFRINEACMITGTQYETALALDTLHALAEGNLDV